MHPDEIDSGHEIPATTSTAVSWREWRWVLIVALLVLTLSSLPLIVGLWRQTPETRYVGASYDLDDVHSHLAKMQQGYRGDWRYQLLFTPEPHQGEYLQLFYVALGHLAQLCNLSLPLTYQLARLLCGLLMLLACYRFIALFLEPPAARQLAWSLAALGSGLGWLVALIVPAAQDAISPIDFWLSDGYLFFALYSFPHFCAAIASLLAAFSSWFAWRSRPAHPKLLRLLALSLLLGLIHPYALLLLDGLLGLETLLRWWRDPAGRVRWRHELGALALLGLSQLPLLTYDLLVFQTRPVFQQWSAQNVTLSPPFGYALLGYGLLVPLALWGAWLARHDGRGRFALLWLAFATLLAYLPWNLQRRFFEGLIVPLAILAAIGLREGFAPLLARWRGWAVLHYPPQRAAWLVAALTVALVTLSNLYLVAGDTLAAFVRHPALTRPAAVETAVDWLGQETSWRDTVLAAQPSGSFIPARVGQRVVLGHWAETLDYQRRLAEVSTFFDPATSDDWRRNWLANQGVRFLFVGPDERALGAFDPDAATYLLPRYRNEQVVIYQVRPD